MAKTLTKIITGAMILAGASGIFADSRRVYQIRNGDTLSQIAKRNELSLENVLSYNPEIKDPDRIFEGQKIYLSNLEEETNKNQEESNYKTENFLEDSEEVLLARMLYGEARGKEISNEERIMIAYTAINRANDRKKWNGTTLKEAILTPWQYSCFNKNDNNQEKLKDPMKNEPERFLLSLKIAKEVLGGKYEELNEGQTHYHTKNLGKYPNWTKDTRVKIIETPESFSHKMYREN